MGHCTCAHVIRAIRRSSAGRKLRRRHHQCLRPSYLHAQRSVAGPAGKTLVNDRLWEILFGQNGKAIPTPVFLSWSKRREGRPLWFYRRNRSPNDRRFPSGGLHSFADLLTRHLRDGSNQHHTHRGFRCAGELERLWTAKRSDLPVLSRLNHSCERSGRQRNTDDNRLGPTATNGPQPLLPKPQQGPSQQTDGNHEQPLPTWTRRALSDMAQTQPSGEVHRNLQRICLFAGVRSHPGRMQWRLEFFRTHNPGRVRHFNGHRDRNLRKHHPYHYTCSHHSIAGLAGKV